jgi:hypothetical protein
MSDRLAALATRLDRMKDKADGVLAPRVDWLEEASRPLAPESRRALRGLNKKMAAALGTVSDCYHNAGRRYDWKIKGVYCQECGTVTYQEPGRPCDHYSVSWSYGHQRWECDACHEDIDHPTTQGSTGMVPAKCSDSACVSCHATGPDPWIRLSGGSDSCPHPNASYTSVHDHWECDACCAVVAKSTDKAFAKTYEALAKGDIDKVPVELRVSWLYDQVKKDYPDLSQEDADWMVDQLMQADVVNVTIDLPPEEPHRKHHRIHMPHMNTDFLLYCVSSLGMVALCWWILIAIWALR